MFPPPSKNSNNPTPSNIGTSTFVGVGGLKKLGNVSNMAFFDKNNKSASSSKMFGQSNIKIKKSAAAKQSQDSFNSKLKRLGGKKSPDPSEKKNRKT